HTQLGLDLRVGVEPLDTCHLLDLESDRVAVLEHEGHVRADPHPAPPFQRDHSLAEVLALALVGPHVGNVGEGEFAAGHGEPSRERAVAAAFVSRIRIAMGSSAMPYARATIWIGCSGTRPVSNMMPPLANEQSPATTSLSAV